MRKVKKITLSCCARHDFLTARQIGDLFGFQPRTNAALCKKWVEGGFLEIVDASNKARKYKLAEPYDIIVKEGLSPLASQPRLFS
jgi:hypothetical protein